MCAGRRCRVSQSHRCIFAFIGPHVGERLRSGSRTSSLTNERAPSAIWIESTRAAPRVIKLALEYARGHKSCACLRRRVEQWKIGSKRRSNFACRPPMQCSHIHCLSTGLVCLGPFLQYTNPATQSRRSGQQASKQNAFNPCALSPVVWSVHVQSARYIYSICAAHLVLRQEAT